MENDYLNELSLFGGSKNKKISHRSRDIKILIIGAAFGSALTFVTIVVLFWVNVYNSDESMLYLKLSEIKNNIEEYYLYGEDKKNMPDLACAAMMNALNDEYSEYYTAEQYNFILSYFNKTKTLNYYMVEGTLYGYIKIHAFSNQSSEEFKEALAWLRKMQAEAFVIDLRGNAGGIVDSAIECLDYLLPEQELVKIVYAHNEEQTIFSDKTDFNLPCVILIDENTISAAELFAGVLKEAGYAYLIGHNTYGKGVMQKYVRLSDNSALRITYAEYVFRNGTKNNNGIAPDKLIVDTENVMNDVIIYLDQLVPMVQ